MKKILFTVVAVFIGSLVLMAQSNDPILGTWKNSTGEAHIEVYKKGDKYFGKLAWINNASKKDENNPNEKLRDRKLLGLEILTNFVKKGKVYEGGQIYDPKSGKTYSCKMTPKDGDKLEVRGFVGVSLLGRTEVFTRVK